MKKTILALSIISMVVSCKKISEGGNEGRLKLEEGTTRYSDDKQSANAASAVSTATHEGTEVDINGTKLHAFKGGLEDSMVAFLASGGYKNAADDAALANQWYNFDQVNFKMGSATELEAGSQQQFDNLAKILKAYPDAKIKIGGYTDKTGNEPANVKLSQDRANFIKSELTKMGVGAQVLGAEGYGSKFATVDAKASDAERAVDRKMAVRFAK